MTLTDSLAGAAPPIRKGVVCGIRRLSEEDQASIADALARGWTAVAIAGEAKAKGIDLPAHTINRHFVLKHCRCSDEA